MNVKIEEIELNVMKALNEIRPFLIADNGDVELVSIKKNTVTVKFLGACTDCSINKMTLKSGIEATIKKYAPQIKKVLSVK